MRTIDLQSIALFFKLLDLFPGLDDVSGSFYKAIMNLSDVLTRH